MQRLSDLPVREQRGSRARCILLTDGDDREVAKRLTNLMAPRATVDPTRHVWMPRGFTDPREARLGTADRFLPPHVRRELMSWWLAIEAGANTPNWDLAFTAEIGGRQGLVLIEAKAHANELNADGKASGGNPQNQARIEQALSEANDGLGRAGGNWNLNVGRAYQLSNRFAWAWKVASFGYPVILSYLGFLNADDMQKEGAPFASHQDWERLVRSHGRGVMAENAWDGPIAVGAGSLQAIIQSVDIPLPPTRALVAE